MNKSEDGVLSMSMDGDEVRLFEQGWPPLFGVMVDGEIQDHEFVNWDSAKEYVAMLLRERKKRHD